MVPGLQDGKMDATIDSLMHKASIREFIGTMGNYGGTMGTMGNYGVRT